MASRYENNVALQPELIAQILEAPKPAWMYAPKPERVFFVGVGTSFHAAQIAAALWRRLISPEAFAVHSFDFARLPQPAKKGDAVVLLSHRGNKSFTVESAAVAHRAGATTIALTGLGSAWKDNLDHRLETCEMEDTGAFTKSMTSTMAWICRWIDDAKLLAGLKTAAGRLEGGPEFPQAGPDTDLVLLGDLEREWVAREIALKVQEAAYLRARAFGLEEFLHGPRISVAKGGVVVMFSLKSESRWQAARDFLGTIEVPFVEVDEGSTPPVAAWLSQLFWGQRLTAALCRANGIDPDALRTADPRYKKAREALAL